MRTMEDVLAENAALRAENAALKAKIGGISEASDNLGQAIRNLRARSDSLIRALTSDGGLSVASGLDEAVGYIRRPGFPPERFE